MWESHRFHENEHESYTGETKLNYTGLIKKKILWGKTVFENKETLIFKNCDMALSPGPLTSFFQQRLYDSLFSFFFLRSK